MIPAEEQPKSEKPRNAGEKAADKIKESYQWWDNLATLNADDPLWLGAAKIGIRVVGILVLLAVSPFAILAILIGFATVL